MRKQPCYSNNLGMPDPQNPYRPSEYCLTLKSNILNIIVFKTPLLSKNQYVL